MLVAQLAQHVHLPHDLAHRTARAAVRRVPRAVHLHRELVGHLARVRVRVRVRNKVRVRVRVRVGVG